MSNNNQEILSSNKKQRSNKQELRINVEELKEERGGNILNQDLEDIMFSARINSQDFEEDL